DELEGRIDLRLRRGLRIGADGEPGAIEGAHAEDIRAGPIKGVPEADCDAEVILHALPRDDAIGLIDRVRERIGRLRPSVSDARRHVGEEVAAHAALHVHRSLARRLSPGSSTRKPVPVIPRAATSGAFGHIVWGSTQTPSLGVWTTTVFRLPPNAHPRPRMSHAIVTAVAVRSTTSHGLSKPSPWIAAGGRFGSSRTSPSSVGILPSARRPGQGTIG